MKRGGTIEPIRIKAKLLGNLGGSQLHGIRQGIGADDVAFPFPQRHDIHVLGLAGAQALDEQGTAAAHDQPHGSTIPGDQEIVEQSQGCVQAFFVHSLSEIVFKRPYWTIQS